MASLLMGKSTFVWFPIALSLLILSIILNFVFIKKHKKKKVLFPIILGMLSSIVIKDFIQNVLLHYFINISVIIAIVVAICIIVVDAEQDESGSYDRS